MKNNDESKPRGFYDLDLIRKIPIVDVCTQLLNLPIEKKGKDYWCKARSERTASTILHADNNTFYDFGSGIGGNVITFVSYVCEVEPSSAIHMLAQNFNIPSINENDNNFKNYISDWEYEQIGLSGDRATKNFLWDFVHTPVERMYELEEKYSIPMNDLRVKYPKIYEQILKQNALPHIYQLRNNYYLNICLHYKLLNEIDNEAILRPEKFSEDIKKLNLAEKIFSRAISGTSINFTPNEYDPVKDLDKLVSGSIKANLGNTTTKHLTSDASTKKTKVWYQTIDLYSYMNANFGEYKHTAFLNGDKVVVGFLASDYKKLRPFLIKGTKEQTNHSLDEKINIAHKNKLSDCSHIIQKQDDREH